MGAQETSQTGPEPKFEGPLLVAASKRRPPQCGILPTARQVPRCGKSTTNAVAKPQGVGGNSGVVKSARPFRFHSVSNAKNPCNRHAPSLPPYWSRRLQKPRV